MQFERKEEEKMECRLPHGREEEVATGDFFYRETLRQIRKKDDLWDGRQKL